MDKYTRSEAESVLLQAIPHNLVGFEHRFEVVEPNLLRIKVYTQQGLSFMASCEFDGAR